MTELSIACTLSQTALRNRRTELNALKPLIRERRQLGDGFALRFDGSTENLMAVAQVIAKERSCCCSLRFELIAEPEAGPLWLQVSGPDNTPQFLFEMFGFDRDQCASSGASCHC